MSGYSALCRVSNTRHIQVEGRYTGQKLYINGKVIAETTNGNRVLKVSLQDHVSESGYTTVYASDGYWDNLLVTDEYDQLGEFFYKDTPSKVVVRHWEPKLDWSNRIVDVGLDRGVAYLNDTAVAWPGLVSVVEPPEFAPPKVIYQDGEVSSIIPYPHSVSGELEALTIPREVRSYLGEDTIAPGITGSGVPPRPFGLSFRSGMGNTEQGTEYGYKIHIWYNVLGEPLEGGYGTLSDSSEPTTKTWRFKSIPFVSPTGKRYFKLVIDSKECDPHKIAILESVLYGYDNNEARLPTPDEIVNILAAE